MADIKQAAKWMKQGNKVKRPLFNEYLRSEQPVENMFSSIVWDDDGTMVDFSCNDLLADDWKLAD